MRKRGCTRCGIFISLPLSVVWRAQSTTPIHPNPLNCPSRSSLDQHPGCDKIARYGRVGAPLTVCRSHKRAHMYTIRDGRLLMSMRDGKRGEEALQYAIQICQCQQVPALSLKQPLCNSQALFLAESKNLGSFRILSQDMAPSTYS